ncbi:hypothetical protein SCOR_22155 [Sulfidibacter corallicola]|uniref:Uncharacterized protein n=1 Tax=Sulfidibacter corallicola TaxID=2818388 RepID=A0A8A4TU31_SULCO|nr:hypothetical protein [Sulfidibacter corallicola]QTD52877.1 hypothetical protein J3U87_10400 [Sulfidibacter corallicola]
MHLSRVPGLGSNANRLCSFLIPLALVLTLSNCGSSGRAVRIELPLPPKLDLTDFNYVYFPGFVANVKGASFDTEQTAINFFVREFRRKEVMPVLDEDKVDLSGKDPRNFFARQQPFFRQFHFNHAEETLAVTGIISFNILDRSGFKDVTTTDAFGRRFNRSQFVEVTGFNLDLQIFVYELNEGKLLYRGVLRDSTDLEGTNIDEQLVFNELLQRVSERVLGLFTNTVVKAERSLL